MPTKINESFICEKCGKENPKADKTCRNHCRYCLFSKHVDKDLPGDRKSNCNGLMVPVEIIDNGKKGKQIVHECLICDKKIANMLAEDDDTDTIIEIMNKQNFNN